MSVLARARRAAAVLRDQVDLDAVRDAVRPAAGAGAPARSERDLRTAARARALGAPDPWALVTAEEAATALGAPAGPPRLTCGDDTTGVIHAAADAVLSVTAFHAPDEEAGAFDPAAHWDDLVVPVVGDDADEVTGIGRAALRTDGGLYVLGDTCLLYVTLHLPDDASVGPPLRALATSVVARLDDGA